MVLAFSIQTAGFQADFPVDGSLSPDPNSCIEIGISLVGKLPVSADNEPSVVIYFNSLLLCLYWGVHAM